MSSSNQLTNSYFVYGTHPIRVAHSNSLDSIRTRTNDFSFPTTHSLNSYSNPTHAEVEEEIFEDASDTFHADSPLNQLSPSTDPSLIDWTQVFLECDTINKLFFQNHVHEAMKMTIAQQNRSLYHSLCHSTICYMKAGMTFNQEDIEATIEATKHTIQMAKKYETNSSWVSWPLASRSPMNEYELHAKLVYAEAILIRALLTFSQDQGLLSFINAGLKLKECNDIFVKLTKQNDRSRFSSDLSYEHFDSGVRMGNGTFNLMISNLPQRVIRYLEFAGFSGNRELGLSDLRRSATSSGLRSTFSSIYLLTYHTFILQTFGNADGDLNLCQTLVERNLQLYPNSYLFLFFKARLEALHCRLNVAIQSYHYAIQCQSDWRNLHHIAFWEMYWCYALEQQWDKAAEMVEILLTENNWSKATSCYMLAIVLYEENHFVATQRSIDLFKRVPKLKIKLAGKSIPFEKYAMKQCERFEIQKWLFLPFLEFAYLMNFFYIIAHDEKKLRTNLDHVDQALNDLILNHQNDRFYADSYGSGLLLRGVLLHFLGQYHEAHQAFDQVMNMSKQFEDRSLLPANACFEKGLIYVTLKDKQRASEYLRRSLNDYKDYQLESRLQFRINAAIQTVKRMNNLENKASD